MSAWPELERRSPAVIDRLLEYLDGKGVKGTFFVLGWLAEQEPDMVRSIAEAGHEIASHGYEHELVGKLGEDGFRSSVRRSRAVLEDVSGQRVRGYRAPSFSIVPGLEWAFDTLLEEGYEYDASLFPVAVHPTYGYPTADRDPFWIEREGGSLLEFPATTLKLFRSMLPASGGAYFRLLPYALVRGGLRQAEKRSSPGMFFIHPWELDDWVPDVAAPRLQMIRTFAGRRRTWRTFDRLFRDFDFGRVDACVELMREKRSQEGGSV